MTIKWDLDLDDLVAAAEQVAPVHVGAVLGVSADTWRDMDADARRAHVHRCMARDTAEDREMLAELGDLPVEVELPFEPTDRSEVAVFLEDEFGYTAVNFDVR